MKIIIKIIIYIIIKIIIMKIITVLYQIRAWFTWSRKNT